MKYDPKIHHRHSLRLEDCDYSQAGAYFVTVVTKDRENLLGVIDGGKIIKNEFGNAVERVWSELPQHYPYILLDEFFIMPNHIHAIVIFEDGCRGGSITDDNSPLLDQETRPYYMKPRHGLSEVIRGFKSFSARQINKIRLSAGIAVWQRSYYDHIIRNEQDLNRIRLCIINNPYQWSEDEENPSRIK